MAIGTLPPVIGEVPVGVGQHGRPAPRPDHPPAAPAAPATSTVGTPTLPTSTVLDLAVAAALGHQDGLGPVFAAAMALAGRPGLPSPVADALSALLAARLGGAPVTPEALRNSVARSGLFHEHRFGEALRQAGSAGPVSGTADLKALLALVRAVLTPMAATADGTAAGERGAAGGSSPAVPRGRPLPPRRGAAPTAQRMPADLAAELDALPDPALAARLVDAADRALARITLHQAASLDTEDAAPAADGDPAPALVLELPLATPAGTAVAELRIESDYHRRTPDEQLGPSWRVDLACAVEPLGSLSARVGLLPGRRIVIGLWCDDPAAVPRLESERAALETALAAAGLDVVGLDLHIGRPPAPRSAGAGGHPPPHRLDVEL